MSKQPTRTRVWDGYYNCIFDSETDDRTVGEFLFDGWRHCHSWRYRWLTVREWARKHRVGAVRLLTGER